MSTAPAEAGLAARALRPSPEAGPALEALRERLDALHYATFQRLFGEGVFRLKLVGSLQAHAPLLPEPTRVAFELFQLGQDVRRRAAEAALGAELVGALQALGILCERRPRTLGSGYRIEHEGELYLLTQGLLAQPDGVYFGEDSRFLARMLRPRPGDVCLDLCTGSGVQGLLCAQRAERVDAVDRNPEALRIARWNVALNAMQSRVSLHHGDLWEALPDAARFDYVVCNPPLIPVPDGVPYPICGDGGSDGLSVVRRILRGLPSRLRERGRASVIGACTAGPGADARPAILACVEEELGAGFDSTVHLLSRVPLYEWVQHACGSIGVLYPGFSPARALLRARATWGDRVDTGHVWTWLLEARRAAGAGGALQRVDLSGGGRQSFWFVDAGPRN